MCTSVHYSPIKYTHLPIVDSSVYCIASSRHVNIDILHTKSEFLKSAFTFTPLSKSNISLSKAVYENMYYHNMRITHMGLKSHIGLI